MNFFSTAKFANPDISCCDSLDPPWPCKSRTNDTESVAERLPGTRSDQHLSIYSNSMHCVESEAETESLASESSLVFSSLSERHPDKLVSMISNSMSDARCFFLFITTPHIRLFRQFIHFRSYFWFDMVN